MQRHVVVVGNGVLGASASYHLTKLGARVTTLDPGTAAAATARSAGLVLHYSHPDKCRLVAQTVADVAALELELDEFYRLVAVVQAQINQDALRGGGNREAARTWRKGEKWRGEGRGTRTRHVRL